MRVSDLTLEHFRSYPRAAVPFGEGVTVLEGPNAAGKTNLLEALWLLSVGTSPRTSRDYQVIHTGGEAARLACSFERSQRQHDLVLLIERGHTTRKRWRLDRVPKTTAQAAGSLATVLFRPDDLDLLSRSASYRRSYLNHILSSSSREHAQLVRRFEKVLTQRRAALELLQQGVSTDLESLNEQLVRDGATLAAARRELVGRLAATVMTVHGEVAGTGTSVALTLSNPHVAENVSEAEHIATAFRSALQQERSREVAAGRNLIGPQRDDLIVLLNGRALRDFGSRGEWRTAIVALKLAELELLAAQLGERPVLLLDDVLSELDEPRRRSLEQWFTRQQTVLATTDRRELSSDLLANATVLSVTRGSVQAEPAHALSR